MRYEIINPSDKCFIKADSFMVACIANAILGGGKYGLKGTDNQNEMPIFIIGGFDEWFKKTFDKDFSVDLVAENYTDVCDCLSSVKYRGERTSTNNIKFRGQEYSSFLKDKYSKNETIKERENGQNKG